MNNRLTYGLIAVLAVIAAVIGALLLMRQPAPLKLGQPPEPMAGAQPPLAAAPAASEPAIRHPVEALATQAQPAALPPLNQSDAHVRAALTGLLGSKAVLSFLQTDDFARRMVATVDNLARSHAAPRLWPVNPAPGRFGTDRAGNNSVIGAANAKRYTAFVSFVESVDTGKAVALYVQLYPLFQQAYEELGYPRQYFNDRLVQVIDQLLRTPEPAGPLAVQRVEVKGEHKAAQPWVHYEFVDPELEALSPGQKLLLRVGPANARRLKAKLAEVRRHITAGSTAR